MNKMMFGAVVVGTLVLSACGGGAADSTQDAGSGAPAPSPQSLGLGHIRISVSGLGTPTPIATAENLDQPGPATVNRPQAHALTTEPCFLQIQSAPVSSGAFNANAAQYASFTFKVRNAQGVSGNGCTANTTYGTLSNITLMGLVEPGLAIDGTPFISLQEFDGSKEPDGVAPAILPTHGMQFDAATNTAQVAPDQESLQVFSEADLTGLAIDPEDQPGSYLLPYGFVVHNVDPTQGRTLQANPPTGEFDGEFTFAVKLPTPGSKKTAVYSFQYDLEVVVDSNTRVTQSAEEQNPLGDLAANLRAIALGSSDLAVLGGTHVTASNIGDPLCTVRIAGTAAAPTAYLANNSAGLGVASAPYGMVIPSVGPLQIGFCQPFSAPAAIFNQFVLNGSASGRRTSGGHYSGNYAGGGSKQLAFTPNPAFRIGEQVLFTLDSSLHSSGGAPIASPWVGLARVTGSAAGSTGGFVPHLNTAVGALPGDIVVGDFNNDGRLDFAVVNANAGTISVELGNGSGGFTAVTGLPTVLPHTPYAIVAGDFNDDGKLDLMVAGVDSTSEPTYYVVLLGNGSGGFSAGPSQSLAGAAATAGEVHAVTGDFNGDGQIDVVIASFNGEAIAVLTGNGNGTFSGGASLSVPGRPAYMAVGDFNGDGKLDLAAPLNQFGKTAILLGDGHGGFTAATGSPLVDPGAFVVAACAGDFNGDGITDLVEASNSDQQIWFRAGKGDGTFASASVFAAGNAHNLACGDFNGDGKLDVAVGAHQDATVTIYLGEGNGQFIQGQTIAPGGNVWGLVIGDFMGSGKLDLLASLNSVSSVSLLAGQ